MLRGIDISNWQSNIPLSMVIDKNKLDFVIVKATEGLNFVDKSCDGFIKVCKQKKILWGYYHFARNNSPEKEAEYFINHTQGYLKQGIPILDLEDTTIKNWKTYVDAWVGKFHSITNVWPMIYISAGALPKIKGCTAYKKCALWIAGYPSTTYTSFASVENKKCPYIISPWNTWTIWQFSSYGKLSGYTGARLDLNLANISSDNWNKIANGGSVLTATKTSTNADDLKKALEVIAQACIKGKYGNGNTRKEKLYSEVQAKINELMAKK